MGNGVHSGRESEARDAVAELRRMRPNYTLERWAQDCDGWSDNAVS